MIKTHWNASNLSIAILHFIISSLIENQAMNVTGWFATIEKIEDPKRKIVYLAECPNFAAITAVVSLARNELDELVYPPLPNVSATNPVPVPAPVESGEPHRGSTVCTLL